MSATYPRRLVVYLAMAMAGSTIGALIVSAGDAWSVSVVPGAQWMALLSLGPALALVATRPVSPEMALAIGTAAATTLLVMWSAFGSDESSTAALVFVLGWFIGIPIAAVFLLVTAFLDRQGVRPPPEP